MALVACVKPPADRPAQSEPLSASTPASLREWRAALSKVPTPRMGCFTAGYPKLEWSEVPCVAAPPYPQNPASGPRPLTVGNGASPVAHVTGSMSYAAGFFDSITGVTTETGIDPGSGSTNPDVFTLQLNTNFFASPACTSSSNAATCQGWQQFVFENPTGSAYIQYWLIGFGGCPGGWNSSGNSCYRNSDAVSVPSQHIANLRQLSLQGSASSTNDVLTFYVGGQAYTVTTNDNVVSLQGHWQDAEFNIFGDANSTQAMFNTNSTLTVRTEVRDGTTNPPTCTINGTTGETNNLTLVNPCCPIGGGSPGILFVESSAAGATSPCACPLGTGWDPVGAICTRPTATLAYVQARHCDPGPTAGVPATFAVTVQGGVRPFTYGWPLPSGLNRNSGGGANDTTVTVTPASTAAATLSVNVTDAANDHASASLSVVPLDPELARRESRLCEIVNQLYRFKRPLYYNPGDPGPLEFRRNLYTDAEVRALQSLGLELSKVDAKAAGQK